MNNKTKNIIIALLTIVILGYALLQGFNYIQNDTYVTGFNDGITQIAITQSQTGNIYYINNNTTEPISINELCQIPNS